jgi:hypothetical protein
MRKSEADVVVVGNNCRLMRIPAFTKTRRDAGSTNGGGGEVEDRCKGAVDSPFLCRCFPL